MSAGRASTRALAGARSALEKVLKTSAARSQSGYNLFVVEAHKRGGLPAGLAAMKTISTQWNALGDGEKESWSQRAKSEPQVGGDAQSMTIKSEGVMNTTTTAIAAAVLDGFAQDLKAAAGTEGGAVSIAGVGRFEVTGYTPKGAKNMKYDIKFSPSVTKESKK